jgi:hypothetical protein
MEASGHVTSWYIMTYSLCTLVMVQTVLIYCITTLHQITPTCCIHSLALSPKIEPVSLIHSVRDDFSFFGSPTAHNSFYCYSIFGLTRSHIWLYCLCVSTSVLHSWITSWNGHILHKLIFLRLVDKFHTRHAIPRFMNHFHSSPPTVPVLSQLNPVYVM